MHDRIWIILAGQVLPASMRIHDLIIKLIMWDPAVGIVPARLLGVKPGAVRVLVLVHQAHEVAELVARLAQLVLVGLAGREAEVHGRFVDWDPAGPVADVAPKGSLGIEGDAHVGTCCVGGVVEADGAEGLVFSRYGEDDFPLVGSAVEELDVDCFAVLPEGCEVCYGAGGNGEGWVIGQAIVVGDFFGECCVRVALIDTLTDFRGHVASWTTTSCCDVDLRRRRRRYEPRSPVEATKLLISELG